MGIHLEDGFLTYSLIVFMTRTVAWAARTVQNTRSKFPRKPMVSNLENRWLDVGWVTVWEEEDGGSLNHGVGKFHSVLDEKLWVAL